MSTLPAAPFDVALIGAGSVGTGVAALLAERGQRIVGVSSRSTGSKERAGALLSAPVSDVESLPPADVYLLGAGPGAFEEIQDRLRDVDLHGRVLVHFSGAHGVDALAASVARGAHACALHPVQACPSVETAVRNLPGSTWGVTCSEGAIDWGAGFVRLLDGSPIEVPEEDRVAWHSAAVITSNGIAALMGAGERILRGLGIEDPVAVLGPLAAGTVANARGGGGGGATLTGPVVRGEHDVVRMHVDRLAAVDSELAEIYAAVSALIARIARASGRIDAAQMSELEATLRRSS